MAIRGWFENSDFSPNQWMELLNNYLRVYYEDQDSDDMDRVYRGQEAQALKALFDRYAEGDATVDELVAFEINYLSDVDGELTGGIKLFLLLKQTELLKP